MGALGESKTECMEFEECHSAHAHHKSNQNHDKRSRNLGAQPFPSSGVQFSLESRTSRRGQGTAKLGGNRARPAQTTQAPPGGRLRRFGQGPCGVVRTGGGWVGLAPGRGRQEEGELVEGVLLLEEALEQQHFQVALSIGGDRAVDVPAGLEGGGQVRARYPFT